MMSRRQPISSFCIGLGKKSIMSGASMLIRCRTHYIAYSTKFQRQLPIAKSPLPPDSWSPTTVTKRCAQASSGQSSGSSSKIRGSSIGLFFALTSSAEQKQRTIGKRPFGDLTSPLSQFHILPRFGS